MPQDAGRFGQGVIAFVAIRYQIHCPVWRIFFFRVEKFLGYIAATAVRILIPDHWFVRWTAAINPHIG
jgi:hypothetical protein